ncbi:DUF6913 domain-containing protein [Bizionia sp. KMM 8389]
MILKGFKEKSIKKQLQVLLNNPKGVTALQPIESVGVIVDADEVSDLTNLDSLSAKFGVLPNKVKIIAFTHQKNQESEGVNNYFCPKDIGWKGRILNNELETFVQTKFSLLVNFYTADSLYLKWLTATSEASFKAGMFQHDNRLNDLIIKTPLADINAFNNELIKYLQVLKTLKHDA